MRRMSMGVRLGVLVLLCGLSFAGCATMPPTSDAEPAASSATSSAPVGEETAVASAATEPVPVAEDEDRDENVPAGPKTTRLKMKPALVNVRPEPGTAKPALAVLKGGKRVAVLEEQGSWVKIRWQRKQKTMEGWVFRRFIEGLDG